MKMHRGLVEYMGNHESQEENNARLAMSLAIQAINETKPTRNKR